MNRIILGATLTVASVTPGVLRGQGMPDNPNRFSFGPTFGLNFKASFTMQPGFYNNVNPGLALGGGNHTYDDGYVRIDSSGDAGGLTGNWGYQNASQVVGNSMQFHGAGAEGSSSHTGDPQYGGEMIYQRVLGTIPMLSGDWGFEGALGVTDIDLRENSSGTVPVLTDSYALNGVVPPAAGYKGTFGGPGVLLGDTPTRTFTTATQSGYQKLSGQLVSIRLGPFAEWYLTHRLSLAASVGLTLAPTTVDYDFSETLTLANGGGSYAANGHSSNTELLYGPYAGVTLRYDFSKCCGVFIGARFQNLTDLSQSVGPRTARLDPGLTVFGALGMTFRF